jgi:hypothetical protein
MATIQNENPMRRMTAALVGFVFGTGCALAAQPPDAHKTSGRHTLIWDHKPTAEPAEISYEPETSASSASSAVLLIQRRHSARGGTTKAAAAAPAKK